MSVKPYSPTPTEVLNALADVSYEIEQILHLGGTFPAEHGLQQNAWLESILVHARALLDFFERDKRFSRRGVELDDVLSKDYGFEAAEIDLSSELRERINKDVAHISYSRQKRVGTSKAWNLNVALTPLFERCLEFTRHIVSEHSTEIDAIRWSGIEHMLLAALRSIKQSGDPT